MSWRVRPSAESRRGNNAAGRFRAAIARGLISPSYNLALEKARPGEGGYQDKAHGRGRKRIARPAKKAEENGGDPKGLKCLRKEYSPGKRQGLPY